MEHGAQIPHRAENLDAHHQDHEQTRELHVAGDDPRCAERQGCGGADRDHAVGDAARERVRAEHPHGAPEERTRLVRQQVCAGRALPEGLERAEALDGIEEFGGEVGIGRLALARTRRVEAVPGGRQQQRGQRKGAQDRRDRQVDECDEDEDEQRRQHRHHELRQILPEIGFELLDAIDERERERARTLPPGIGRPERRDTVEQLAAQALLDERRGLVRDDGPPVLAGAARRHDDGDSDYGPDQLGRRVAGEDAADRPAEQRQPRHAERRRQQPDRHRQEDAPADALGEAPQAKL